MRTFELISPRYRDEQRQLHAAPRGYGQRGSKWADTVLMVATTYGAGSVLDYGCGQGSLAAALRERPGILRVEEYDPAIAGKDHLPSFADMVVCTDVMEHVEGDRIPNVIAHLSLLTRKVLFLVVALVPTAKTLSTGEQAHISLYDVDWWRTVFSQAFEILDEPLVKPEKQWVAILKPLGPA